MPWLRPLFTIVLTIGCVVAGGVVGYQQHVTSYPWGWTAFAAFGGFVVAFFTRMAVLDVLVPIWRRRSLVAQFGWMALQAGFTAVGIWVGVSTPLEPSESRQLMLVTSIALFFGFGLAITYAWAWSADLLRYTLPNLFRRAKEKHRRKAI